MDFNSFNFVGRLVDDLKIVASDGTRPGYGQGRMATNGRQDSDTLWLTVFFPESVIGNIYQYLTKGKPLVVTGRLSQNEYQDKNGQTRQGLTVNATSVNFIQGQQRANGEGEQPTSAGKERGGKAANSNLPF